MSEIELQEAADALAERTAKKQEELNEAENGLKALIGQIVEAEPVARKRLIANRAELVNLRDLLRDELQELQNRRDAAHLAIFVYREDQAREEFERLRAISHDRRVEMQTVCDKHLHFLNRGSRSGGETEESHRELVAMEMEKARAIAESSIAGRAMEKARNIWQQAQYETQAAKAELGAK